MKIEPNKIKIIKILIFIILVTVFITSVKLLNLDFIKFLKRLNNFIPVIQKMMIIDFSNIKDILLAVLTSIAIALCSLFLGLIAALLISFYGASNTTPNQYLASMIKSIIAVIRAIPALVWILMIVVSLGFGNSSGVVGLFFPTFGYLSKAFIASIEDIGENTIEALKTTGATRLSIIIHGLIPELSTTFIGYIALRFEMNIAESIMLGVVGVGGIGTLLMKSISKYDYANISAIILVVFLLMFLIEIFVNKIKLVLT